MNDRAGAALGEREASSRLCSSVERSAVRAEAERIRQGWRIVKPARVRREPACAANYLGAGFLLSAAGSVTDG